MLFIVENGLCHSIYSVTEEEYVTLLIDMLMLIINRKKIMIKIKTYHTFNIGMEIIYMTRTCRKSFQ